MFRSYFNKSYEAAYKAYQNNYVMQYEWPMMGQYTFILTNCEMYTGLSLVIFIV